MSYINGLIKSILVDPNIDGAAFPVLTFTAGGGYNRLYEVVEAQGMDIDPTYVEIPWAYETGFVANEDGGLYTFAAIQLRAALSLDAGNGATNAYLRVEIIPLDETSPVMVRDMLPVSRPKQWYSAVANLVTEQVRIRLSGYNQIFLSTLSLFVSRRGETRPRD